MNPGWQPCKHLLPHGLPQQYPTTQEACVSRSPAPPGDPTSRTACSLSVSLHIIQSLYMQAPPAAYACLAHPCCALLLAHKPMRDLHSTRLHNLCAITARAPQPASHIPDPGDREHGSFCTACHTCCHSLRLLAAHTPGSAAQHGPSSTARQTLQQRSPGSAQS